MIQLRPRNRRSDDGAPEVRGTRIGQRDVLRVSIVLLALLVLVAGPVYLTGQPEFFGRLPALDDEYIPWSTSTHLEAACEDCHVSPSVLPRVANRARLVGEFYLTLVLRSRRPGGFESPPNAACLACHSDLRTVSPKGDLQIPHRAHVTILEMRCVECHQYLVHELSPEGKHTPPMVECLRCHDGDAAKNACSACHTEKAAPASHRAENNWLVAHAAQADDPDCVTCHKWADNWCVECHSQRPRSHGTDWRAVHGLQVGKHRSCEACHEGDFCIRCHGELPALNLDPTLELVR